MTSEGKKQKPIVFTHHARQRMKERGASEEAVERLFVLESESLLRRDESFTALIWNSKSTGTAGISVYNRLPLLSLRKKIAW
jgi:hypothetical protein